jgi:3-(3-hydroxy-phenyl)propionate hydroxylase
MAGHDRVIIAGAGPVGLVAAMRLADRGIPVLVMEASPDLPVDLRASTYHPPTLDILDQYGITQMLIDDGLIAPTWQFRDRESGERAVFDLGLIKDETAHPYRVQCEQHKMTRLIYKKIKDWDNVEIWFDAKVKKVGQDANSVWAVVERGSEEVTVKGRYLIGADGASSAVRTTLDVGFDGVTYPEWFVQATTPFEFRDYLPDLSLINYVTDSEEWFVLLRVIGKWRALFPSREGETQEEAIADESLQKRLNGIHKKAEPYEILHKTIYRIHQRVATTYNIGRAFLAGDAAHLNNPLGGMGMNGGIHDAVNICDKLTAVWRGEGDESLFDLYTRQRQPIAVENVQAQAERNRKLLNERDPKVRLANFRETQRTAEDPELARDFLLRSSMIEGLRRAETIV